ncbi:hypothetical protein [Microcella sp.]|uniref:hypothetical protein n=1 Tax=Microcella sp. TaxID=1913979 RepID=UPI002566744D|nr:hypothetical protein [Microcella sp.]MBX9472744.1 hypothetical protein [Microcella sp.]
MAHPTLLESVVGVREPLGRGLIVVIVALGALHVVAVVTASFWRTATPTLRSTVGAWFHLDSEAGLGTWFAVLQLALAATIAALIAARERSEGRTWRGWAFVAAVLAAMSLDEQILAHEQLGRVAASMGLAVGGVSPWFLVAPVVLVIVGCVVMPFAARLLRRTRRGLIVAGAVFVLGALGFELLSWAYVLLIAHDPAAALSPVVGVLQLCEESLELLGVTLAISALLDHAWSTARSPLGAHSTTP